VNIVLHIRTVSESNARGHWSKRAKRARDQRSVAKLVVAATLRGSDVASALPCVSVTLTRIAPRSLDDDNLRGALKAVRDGVADALGVDDGHASITWQYAQEKGPPKVYAVVVEVGPC
jgi:hypothetical protein